MWPFRYAFSLDGFNWTLSLEEAWDVDLTFDDCSGLTLGKRQRAALVSWFALPERFVRIHLRTHEHKSKSDLL